MWSVRSIADDILIDQRKGYCIAEYEPLELKAEGGTEREARDALMLDIWSTVARMYEEMVSNYSTPTIKEMMDDHIANYWATHTPKTRYRDEKMGVIPLEVELPSNYIVNPDGTIDVFSVAVPAMYLEGREDDIVSEASGEETSQDMETK